MKHPKILLTRLLFIFAMIILGFFLLILLLTPLRNWGANKYVGSGDKYLAELKYLDAIIEYQKASILTPLDPQINQKIKLAENAETNILVIKDFLKSMDNRAFLNSLSSINEVKTDPQKLVELSRTFVERNQPQLAVVAAKQATELKDNYRDGLLYLAIAYDKSARTGNVRQESFDYLITQRDRTHQLAVSADPAYFANN